MILSPQILLSLVDHPLFYCILRGAPGLGQEYPPRIEAKPIWFKPLFGVDFKDYKLWSWLEATKSLGLPISEEAD